MAPNKTHDHDDPTPRREDDARQQPWPGTDPTRANSPGTTPLADQEAPEQDGVHVGPSDDLSDVRGPDRPRPADVTRMKPGVPNMPDEAGESSLQNADQPQFVREEISNTSTSSGTQTGDEGDDQRRRRLLEQGAREISSLD